MALLRNISGLMFVVIGMLVLGFVYLMYRLAQVWGWTLEWLLGIGLLAGVLILVGWALRRPVRKERRRIIR